MCALEDNSVRNEILLFESALFEKNSSGIEKAELQLNNIFENLSLRSCRTIKVHEKKKKKKKKPWNDRELADLRKKNCISFTKTTI